MFRNYLIGFFFVLTTVVQGQPLRFADVPLQSSILSSNIYDLTQDENGFIWIASSEGLGKYDGHNIVEFKHAKNIEQGLCSNTIYCLYAAKNGRIWIGTKGGISFYDPLSEEVICLDVEEMQSPEGSNIILDIMEDQKGYIWYSTYQGVFRYNTKENSIKAFLPDSSDPFSIHNKLVYTIFEDDQGKLWFAGSKGISYCKNDESMRFVNILPEPDNPLGLQHNLFFSFCQTDNGQLWLGGDSGLYKIHQKSDGIEFTNYKNEPATKNSLSYNYISHILADKNDLWASTWAGGLNKITTNDNDCTTDFIHHRMDKDNSFSLLTDEVNVTLIDNAGVLWVGTGFGLMNSSPSTNKFGSATASPNVKNSLSTNKIQCTLVDSEGNLWVGTDNGLNFQASKHKGRPASFRNYFHIPGDNSSLCHNNIFDLYEDSSKRIWIATYSGLSILNLNSFTNKPVFKNLRFYPIPHKWVYNILETEKDVFWVSTYGKLARMSFPVHASTPEMEIFDMDPGNPKALSNATTYQTCQDLQGRLWIGTYYGLSMIEAENDTVSFTNFYPSRKDQHSLSDVTITCIYQDERGHLWIGTKNGLNLLEEQDSIMFRTFDEQNGLPNSVISFIEEDDHGRLWIGTGDGLVHFDPEKALVGSDPVLNVYTAQDGLGSNHTNIRSSCKDQEGNIYFATEGLNYFNPRDLKINKNIPALVFTKLKVNNQDISPASHPQVLKNSISEKGAEIHLSSTQNMIQLYFSSLDFSNPNKNKYKYKLDGFNTEWVTAENQNFATYTNLNAGSYIFKVLGSNNDGIWNQSPISIPIHVAPHWSKSNLAYIIYLSLFLSLLGIYHRWKKARAKEKIQIIKDIELARFEEREELRKKNAADFHDELGHRLTKISLFLEIAGKHAGDNENLINYLQKVKTNTKSLSDGLKDLIWSLDPSKDTMLDTINRVQEIGDNLYDFSSINFSTSAISPAFAEMKLNPTKRKHLLLIFKEAMNNTLKYSKAENCVFRAELKSDKVILAFQDDGKGFDMDKKRSGQGLENMKERARKIDGALQIVSTLYNGTEIKIIFPLKENNNNQ